MAGGQHVESAKTSATYSNKSIQKHTQEMKYVDHILGVVHNISKVNIPPEASFCGKISRYFLWVHSISNLQLD